MKLDKIELERNHKWLRDLYYEKFDRVIDTFERMLVEIKDVRSQEPEYNVEFNFDASYRVSQVENLIKSAFSNIQLGQFINAAGDLDTVKKMIVGIEALRKELPPEVTAVWEKMDLEVNQKRDAEILAADQQRAEADLVQCHFKSYSERCARKGSIEVKGKLYCKQHSNHPDCGKPHNTAGR